MIAALLQFYRRHKKRVLWAVGLLTTGYLVLRYINNKRMEYIEYQQHIIKQKIKKKYQQTQKDCTFTVIALLPSLSGAIYKLIPVENITKQLLSKRDNKKKNLESTNLSEFTAESEAPQDGGDNKPGANVEVSKSKLWNELKLKSLTRLLTLVYSNSILVILIRLQLNILARKDYLESSMEAANVSYDNKSRSDAATSIGDVDYMIEQSYLSLSWWLMNKGYNIVYEQCQDAVNLVFKDISARTELTFNEFSTLIAKAQEIIDKHIVLENDFFLEKCMVPPPDLEAFVISKSADTNSDDEENNEERVNEIVNDENFRILVEETREYINHEAINPVIIRMITNSIGKFLNDCSKILLGADNIEQNEEVDIELITKRFKLARILSTITKESSKVSESSINNEYIQVMNAIPELEDYTASVYSNFAI